MAARAGGWLGSAGENEGQSFGRQRQDAPKDNTGWVLGGATRMQGHQPTCILTSGCSAAADGEAQGQLPVMMPLPTVLRP